ncbi:MAG: nucleoside triphosphate pyrophosphohydrolase [Pseudomonadales bacterium]
MKEMQSLLEVMQRLRDPDGGCPWDLEQNFQTIAPYTIEEAYEVADAIEREDYIELKHELGDLLLQVVFHAQMADEAGLFNFADVAGAISAKLIRRHPHVFGDESHDTASEVLNTWENIKSEERQGKQQHGTLDDVPGNLPALLRAQKLQKRAARVGFDWSELSDVIAKVGEEM